MNLYMTCTGSAPTYIHTQAVIPVDSNTPDFSPFQFSVFTCDIPAPATPSGIMAATVEIASGSAQAIADGIYSLWFPLVFMLMLVAVIIGTYIYKK